MSLLDVARDAIKSGRLRRPTETGGTHVMHVMNHKGDDTMTWNPNDIASVDAARREFRKLIRDGYQAFQMDVVRENGVVIETKGARVTEFDPAAGKLMMVPHMRGG